MNQPGTGLLAMDKELLTALAEATARVAATEIGNQLRNEIARQFVDAKADMRRDLASYFGELKPDAHIIQHNRLDRFLDWMDAIQGKFWGKVAMGLIIVGLAGAVFTYIIGAKLGLV